MRNERSTDIEIIPAVLPKSFADLESHLSVIHSVAKMVQVDIVDGRFAHNKTWPYKDHETFEKIVAEEHGLPFWDDLDFEFDLMIQDPHLDIIKFIQAGGSRMVVHADAAGALEGLRILAEAKGEAGAFSITTGLALLPSMQPDVLESFESLFDYVQVMGINKVGHQGEAFEPHSLALIERLRRRYPDLVIQVDGGVNLETIESLVLAGANRLVVGSAIFGEDNPEEAYKALYTKANAPRDGN